MDQARVTSALALLKKINQEGYKSVICGGYVRDTICDKPIRDIDLYVSGGDFRRVREFLTDEDCNAVSFDDSTPEYRHQSITRQEEFCMRPELQDDLPTDIVNLIGLHDHDDQDLNVKSIISRFNLGICKAGIELSAGRCVIEYEFRRDYKDKQITLYRTDWGYEATMKQFIKLQAKYPWPLRIPPKTEEDVF
ncbi:hypothetical protein [Bradyrhizobium retamae]|uniref:Poly A polymerase head domain-containing protein n=1 Tax=Bradyrhizobium retamae TaxID=1300035 RepID=A0A0R3MWB1_9BRAD|nr:hypothetical protein [Bradyrhizobium retamae]KRR22173.1 hypothetical protein CQ13_30040 [Bradyrhizobium retamae]